LRLARINIYGALIRGHGLWNIAKRLMHFPQVVKKFGLHGARYCGLAQQLDRGWRVPSLKSQQAQTTQRVTMVWQNRKHLVIQLFRLIKVAMLVQLLRQCHGVVGW